jgi:oligopeptide/dipeptide ABC transporter ATP-binding protein
MENKKLLEVKDLRTTFISKGVRTQAVRGVSFSVERGDILGIVGESGSGKSVLMKTVIGILPENAVVESGSIVFDQRDLTTLSEKELRQMKGKEIAMVFQDPMSALNPLKRMGEQVEEVLIRHRHLTKAEAKQEVITLLRKVEIPTLEKRVNQYPHEFSGGMRQRVLIAMALACNPKLLIADEPTTALDVTIQAQILELLKELQRQNGMSIILITHDLGVGANMCNRIVVMYGGLVMEEGTVDQIFYSPMHPYTKALLHAIPKLDAETEERLEPIPGMTPSLVNPPEGCAFAARCAFAAPRCQAEKPPHRQFNDTQYSTCFYSFDSNGNFIGEE